MYQLEADSIRKEFGRRPILRDVYIKCLTGEIVGLLGRNGCGKSTLLKILFGTLDTPHKSIRVDGQYYPYPYLIPGLISYLPQESIFPVNTKISKILKMLLSKDQFELMGKDERIEPHMNKPPKKLSGGERKYLEVSFILSLGKKFVLLDEPFTGIEPIYREIIAQKLQECSQDQGIIISDHDYRKVLVTSNRQYYLTDGVLREIDGLKDLEKFGYVR